MPIKLSRWTPAVILVIAGSTHSLAVSPFGPALDLLTLDGTNGFACNGINAGEHSVSNAGDVNGDGIDDIIIGDKFASPNGLNAAGESYVIFGSATVGAGGTLDLSALNGTNGFVCNGSDAEGRSGVSVSAAGDVNGDGIDDLIIGSADQRVLGPNLFDKTYVVFGSVGIGAGGTLELSTLNGTNGFVCKPVDIADVAGYSVSAAGDVNGDGIDDVIIGAPFATTNGQIFAGASYVVFGAIGVGASGNLDFSTLNGTNGFVCNGVAANDFSGGSVSNAGDINGDGIGDLIIGAQYAFPGAGLPMGGQGGEGQTYVVFGAVGIGAGGSVELSALNGTNGFTCNGSVTQDNSGGSVSSAGDVNGDGMDDVIIGARKADSGCSFQNGKSYVIYGDADVGIGGTIELSSLDGTEGFRLNGADSLEYSGDSVAGAGDVNGDGIDDLIIGAYDASETYIVFGGSDIGITGARHLIYLTDVTCGLDGTTGFVCNGIDEIFENVRSVSPAGDVNDDGIDDFIIGSSINTSYVVFGKVEQILAGDINDDGIVDTADLGILIGNFGETLP